MQTPQQKPKRISLHIPYDLTEIVEALANRDNTPTTKWLVEIIRREIREKLKQDY